MCLNRKDMGAGIPARQVLRREGESHIHPTLAHNTHDYGRPTGGASALTSTKLYRSNRLLAFERFLFDGTQFA